MFGWLRKRHATFLAAPAQPGSGTPWRVTFDEDDVRLFQPDSPPTRLAWEDLGQVGIVTTPVGRSEPDLYWILQSLDRASSVVIPMGATGEHELLHELQARLVGFDNMAVIEAMSSTEAARFVVWQKPG